MIEDKQFQWRVVIAYWRGVTQVFEELRSLGKPSKIKEALLITAGSEVADSFEEWFLEGDDEWE